MKDLNEWAEKVIKEIEDNGNTFIGGKLCLKDSGGENWFIPIFPEIKQPEKEGDKTMIRDINNIRGMSLEDISMGDYIDGLIDVKTGFLTVRKARSEQTKTKTEREKICDELLDYIGCFNYIPDSEQFKFIMCCKIKEIRENNGEKDE